MAIVCVNGHVNNEANRFCDQCGAPLDQSATQGATAASDAVAPMSSSGAGGSVLCPQCGQQNLPGTAFCDNCGAALPPPQPAQDSAALPLSDTEATMQEHTTTNSDTLVCPQCGAVNAATNRFCDNCGMALATLGSDQQAASEQGQAMANDAQAGADVQQEQPEPAAQPSEPAQPAETAEPTTTAPDTAPPVATEMAAQEDETQAAQPAAAAGTPDSSAQRQQLEATIATQQRLIDQLEQMQATFGAATPPAVVQGLDEARSTLAQAQAELEALETPAPAVDPAEVARLEAAVATQQQLVSQLEQMQATFGGATPPSILQGLDEARAGLAQAQAELEALTGAPTAGSTPAPGAPAPVEIQTSEAAAQHADVPAAQPVAGDESPAAQMTAPQAAERPASPPPPLTEPEAMAPEAAVAADQPAQPATPDVSGPRLVTHDGQAIKLPSTAGDILIGRQDPVSGVYPGVDLTPYGGEAGGVSRRHALLREQNGQWMLTDLDSTNYTRVDGNRIAPHTPTEIGDGARLQFGRVDLAFHTS